MQSNNKTKQFPAPHSLHMSPMCKMLVSRSNKEVERICAVFVSASDSENKDLSSFLHFLNSLFERTDLM